MARERLYLFDTTLRDGAQTNGVDFTLADKLAIAGMLDELGIDYVEGGYPGANPTDTELFCDRSQARTRDLYRVRHDAAAGPLDLQRSGPRGAARRQGRRHLLCRQVVGLTTSGSRWRRPTRKTSPRSATALRAAKAKGREVLLDCEHFFDGYKANPQYALACAKAAYDAGARWVVLCDTNGGTLPHEVEEIVGEVCKTIPGDHVGIHAHNDTEQAVANSLAAVRAGARQIQGTHQRPRRALRQCQPGFDHPDAEAQGANSRSSFEIGVSDDADGEAGACLAQARRHAQSRAEPPRALCRRKRLRHQGRHPCLGDHERSRRPMSTSRRRASATGASFWSRSSPASRMCWRSSSASASKSTRTIRASGGCSRW